jgi:predicted HTH domain antitoxin
MGEASTMSKVNIQIDIPEHIRGTEREHRVLASIRKHALERAVLELYKEREISTGTGARMLGLPLYDFMQFLGKHEISVFPSTDEEIAEEMENVENARKQVSEEVLGKQ